MQLTAFLFTPSRFTDYYYSSFASKSLFRSKTTSSGYVEEKKNKNKNIQFKLDLLNKLYLTPFIELRVIHLHSCSNKEKLTNSPV